MSDEAKYAARFGVCRLGPIGHWGGARVLWLVLMTAILKLADLVMKGRYSCLLDKCKTSYILYSVLGNASLRNRGKPSQSMLQ